MDLQLSGRVVVVTGASAGIGRSTALALAAEGAHLVLGSRKADDLEKTAELARALGAQVVVSAGDLTQARGVDDLFRAAVNKFDHVFGLVTCVGSTPLGGFSSVSDTTWQQAFEMKFLATVRAIRAFIPCLREGMGGRIVVVTGNRAQKPTAGMLTSSVINSALSSLVAAIGTDLAAQQVGIVTVSPGAVNTARYRAMVSALMNDSNLDEVAARARISKVIPDGRVADPDEVGSLVSYLISPMAAHINSADFVIDGGESRAS